MRIAITTPTGTIGRRVVRMLRQSDSHRLVLLTRRSALLPPEQARGLLVLPGDPQDSAYVQNATLDADALLWVIAPSHREEDYRAAQRRSAIVAAQAARRNYIRHVVLLSRAGAHHPSETGLIAGLHDAEKILADAVESLTVIRSGYPMEEYLWQVQSIRKSGCVYLPVSGATRVTMTAAEDVARMAAAALLSPPKAGRQVLPLSGPRDYSFDEAAAAIGHAIGHDVRHIRVSQSRWQRDVRAGGASEHVARLSAQMYIALECGLLQQASPRTIASTTRTTFERFAAETLRPAIQRGVAV